MRSFERGFLEKQPMLLLYQAGFEMGRYIYADLAQACLNVSRPTIKRVLGRLRQEGKVECIKPGRDAVWEKRGS